MITKTTLRRSAKSPSEPMTVSASLLQEGGAGGEPGLSYRLVRSPFGALLLETHNASLGCTVTSEVHNLRFRVLTPFLCGIGVDLSPGQARDITAQLHEYLNPF